MTRIQSKKAVVGGLVAICGLVVLTAIYLSNRQPRWRAFEDSDYVILRKCGLDVDWKSALRDAEIATTGWPEVECFIIRASDVSENDFESLVKELGAGPSYEREMKFTLGKAYDFSELLKADEASRVVLVSSGLVGGTRNFFSVAWSRSDLKFYFYFQR